MVRRPSQKRGKETREAIVATARRLFGEMGLEQTTTNHIAQEAGVSVGSVYAYFKDKNQIFAEVVAQFNQEAHRQFRDLLQELIDGGYDLAGSVERLIGHMEAWHQRERGLHRQIVIQGAKNPAYQEVRAGQDPELDHLLSQWHQRMGDQVRVDDLETGLFLVHTAISETIHHLLLYGSPVPESRVFAQLARMITAYLSGAAARPA